MSILKIKTLPKKILKLKIETIEEIIAVGLDTDDTFYAMLQFYKIELSRAAA